MSCSSERYAGRLRIQAITAGVVRLEWSEDGVFEDAATMTGWNRSARSELVVIESDHETIGIRVGDADVRIRHDGVPEADSPAMAGYVEVHRAGVTSRPFDIDVEGIREPLGGWRRCLDHASGPQPLLPGLLYRDGWSWIDDTATALWNEHDVPMERPARTAGYRDGYLFVYGDDVKSALHNLALLAGPFPHLPLQAFGFWWSHRLTHPSETYRDILLPRFREHGIPVDVLVLDTDVKTPQAWNGWSWNKELIPDVDEFFTWAASENLLVTVNAHPSMWDGDIVYEELPRSVRDSLIPTQCFLTPDQCYTFDLGRSDHRDVYAALHQRMERGRDPLWWYDAADGVQCGIAGVSTDVVANQWYARRAEVMGHRGFSWARIGGESTDFLSENPDPNGPWAERRTTVQFTGDINPGWSTIAFCAEYSGALAGAGLAYSTHDLGSFRGGLTRDGWDDISPEEYVRWVQLGVLQPVMRVHGWGKRLPWEFPEAEMAAAAAAIRLRASLVPYLYTQAWRSRETGCPMTRPMWLEFGATDTTLDWPGQFLCGDALLVAPVVEPDGATCAWIPPGTWAPWWGGQVVTGPTFIEDTCALDRFPLYLRGGHIVISRANTCDSVLEPVDQVTVNLIAGMDAAGVLYEDNGVDLGYRLGQHQTTNVRWVRSGSEGELVVDAAVGAYEGAVEVRKYTVLLFDCPAIDHAVVIGGDEPITIQDCDGGRRQIDIGWHPTGEQLRLRVAFAVSEGRDDES